MLLTPKRFFALYVFCTSFFYTTFADVQLIDPQILDGEITTYDLSIGNYTSSLENRVFIVEKNNVMYYRFVSRFGDNDLIVEITKNDMKAQSSVMTISDKHCTIERTSSLKKSKQPLESDELGLIDYYSLSYVLRGFPFGSDKKVSCVFLGETKFFSFQIKQTRNEEITVNNKTFNCYHLTLSVPGFFRKLFAKTHFWYTVDKPHYLVKYEGPFGGPGSPKQRLELRSFSKGKNATDQ